jgi:predicted ribosome quality control (RQC) complex YloA/Tae2 family protein
MVKNKIKFRELKTSSEKELLLGKDKESNDFLVKRFKDKENIILHTAEPGSPFCIINNLIPSQKDVKEAAIICAKYSQDWRDNKKDVIVHIFTGKDVSKRIWMKTGTFGVKNFKKTRVKKEDIIKFEKRK